jgi:hypothetical protein
MMRGARLSEEGSQSNGSPLNERRRCEPQKLFHNLLTTVCGGHVWIGNLDPVHLGPRRQRVLPRPNAAGDLAHCDAPDEEGVRDERTVTAPWNRLRAH